MIAAASIGIPEIVIILIGSGGLGAAITALIKGGAEKNKIVIDAANGAVLIQSTVLDEVNAAYENTMRELRAANVRLDEMSGLKDEVERLTEENAELRTNNTRLTEENTELRDEVKVLTDRVKRLEGGDATAK